jgi:hypothetical protein
MNTEANLPQHITQVLEKVSQIATMAGYTVKSMPERNFVAVPFDMGNGRKQVVYVRYIGQTPDEHDVVSFDSPCMEVKKGWLRGLSKDRAIDLLKRNANLLFGRFAIEQIEGEDDVLIVCSTQIIDTMEVEEFDAHCRAVAVIADEYEKELGTDHF